MYAVQKTYLDHIDPNNNFCKVLKPRYKTARGAEKAAQRHRSCCKTSVCQKVVTESTAVVILVKPIRGSRQ